MEHLQITAREVGCRDVRLVGGLLHVTLPTGERGRFRAASGGGFAWDPDGAAE